MRDSIIVTSLLLIFVFSTAFANWLEEQSQKIDALNKKYIADIKRFRTIAQINLFLESEVAPFIVDWHNDSIDIEKKMVDFVSENQNRYNLLVEKFIYEDGLTKNIDLSYKIERDKKDLLNDFLATKYKNGFLQFRELKLHANELSGKLQVIQPFSRETHLSQKKEVEDVPQ